MSLFQIRSGTPSAPAAHIHHRIKKIELKLIYIFIDICCFHKFEMSDLLLLLPLLLHHKLQWHLILQLVQANQFLLLSSRWRWWRQQWWWWGWCCLRQLWWYVRPKTLLRWLTMPAPMESPRTLIAVRNLKENIILATKNVYHHPQPGCKHYDDSYWYDDGDLSSSQSTERMMETDSLGSPTWYESLLLWNCSTRLHSFYLETFIW